MQLLITKDIGGRFKAGQIRNYPRTTWGHIAHNVGQSLEQFTRPVDEAAQSTIAQPHIRRKQG